MKMIRTGRGSLVDGDAYLLELTLSPFRNSVVASYVTRYCVVSYEDYHLWPCKTSMTCGGRAARHGARSAGDCKDARV